MNAALNQLILDRTGPADATVGMISLPIPRDLAGKLRIDHAGAAAHPVAWWKRNEVARRELAFVVDNAGVPASVRLTDKPVAEAATAAPGAPGAGLRVEARISKEQLPFKAPKFNDIASLRGVPYADTTHVEYEVLLTFGQRSLVLQLGATSPRGVGPFWWQNVQVDPLWENAAVQAVRLGGIIYNNDTYLWADVFLLLFRNGVAHVAAHFHTTKLHIEGYDFQGLPAIRLAGKGGAGITLPDVDAALPAAGDRFAWPGLQLNLADARSMVSPAHPGKLQGSGGELLWWPWSRTFNPQMPDAPEQKWPAGFGRTARFQFSLSDAAPAIAGYKAPSWWYALAGEPWAGGYLPVRGRFSQLGQESCEYARGLMTRGRFDASSAGYANDGHAGIGLMVNSYFTGRDDLYTDALDYCYYWADIAVDHRDFSVHQWIGGWPWKTCAYSKFRDVLMGYLETGDPYLLDTLEGAADQYWGWFRANWPRNSIGRDAFEVGGWAILRRFLGTERARERTREFVRMMGQVLATRGVIGGQMGAGPHPGYLSSLYMTGVAMDSFMEVAEAELEENASGGGGGGEATLATIHAGFAKLHKHYNREDVEVFPSNYGRGYRPTWKEGDWSFWSVLAMRAYAGLGRTPGADGKIVADGLGTIFSAKLLGMPEWGKSGRPGSQMTAPLYHDALMLGARVVGDGVELSPLGTPDLWPAQQTVATPWGDLQITTTLGDGEASVVFAATKPFPVTLKTGGKTLRSASSDKLTVPAPRVAAPANAR